MNILKIIHGFPPIYEAGSEVYTKNLVEELSYKHQVILFSRYENEYELDFKLKVREKKKVKHYLVNMPRKKETYHHKELDLILNSILEKEKIDIAHIGHLNHLSTGFIDLLKKKKIPIVFTLHDFWLMCPRGQFVQRNSDGKNYYSLCSSQNNLKCAKNCFSIYHDSSKEDLLYWRNWVKKRMQVMKRIVKKVNLFIAPSEYLLNRFIKDFNVPKNKIILKNYGFKIPKKISKIKNSIFTFGYIGTHIPSKAVNLLIQSFKESKIEARLFVFGAKTNSDQFLELDSRIEFKGNYKNEDIYKSVLNQIDCLVIPSIWMENSPLVCSEARIAGIPVLVADKGGMKELSRKDKNIFTFKHRDNFDLTKKIEFIFNLKNKKFASTKMNVIDITKHTNEILEIYKSFL